MKKIILFAFIITFSSCSFAQDNFYNPDKNEIYLDSGTNYKEYKIKKPEYHNDIKQDTDDDDPKMPVDFVTTPLKLLRQYQSDMY